jgi:flagellar basal body-associated protein FliL
MATLRPTITDPHMRSDIDRVPDGDYMSQVRSNGLSRQYSDDQYNQSDKNRENQTDKNRENQTDKNQTDKTSGLKDLWKKNMSMIVMIAIILVLLIIAVVYLVIKDGKKNSTKKPKKPKKPVEEDEDHTHGRPPNPNQMSPEEAEYRRVQDSVYNLHNNQQQQYQHQQQQQQVDSQEFIDNLSHAQPGPSRHSTGGNQNEQGSSNPADFIDFGDNHDDDDDEDDSHNLEIDDDEMRQMLDDDDDVDGPVDTPKMNEEYQNYLDDL